ncbi:PREDICTED: protein FAM177A1-like [Wasmannia auropunctata]|uniref:protein FAM177A1-like n=1 Tax=Wasmannia auropunctata TaxID=64793 RepID=UPI0005EFF05F|nr:PREDICTED: protein FAM177A1-like [Wasmannia auropunctata]
MQKAARRGEPVPLERRRRPNGIANSHALPFVSQRRAFRMSHQLAGGGERRARGVRLLGALSRVVRARGGTRGFVYRKIRPTMASEREDDIGELSDIILQESSDAETLQCKRKLSRKPKRVLQFSDGVMEEYSSEDEVDAPKNSKIMSQIDTKNMNWLPWAWYQTTLLSSKMLDGCDYVGECLANFFGITAPKYQFEINEFYRLQALEREMLHKQDLEMGGWNEQKKNNLINKDATLTSECK